MALNIPKVPMQLTLPKELPKDLPSTITYMKSLVESLQLQINLMATILNTMQGADVLANRPTPRTNGATYYATDAVQFYVFDGTTWQTLV